MMITLRHRQSVFVSGILVLIIGMLFDYSTNIDRLGVISTSDHQASAATNSIDQIIKQRNATSNQSSDLRDIRKLTSEEVQLLRQLGQGFSRTTTQSQFAALGIFLIGISLIIYGLRLTVKATDKQTSRYFKAMIWALIIPVIALIAVYQIGILLGHSILLYISIEPFFFVSVLLLIPATIIIILLLAEKKLVGGSHRKD
jgi:hypothetical protein